MNNTRVWINIDDGSWGSYNEGDIVVVDLPDDIVIAMDRLPDSDITEIGKAAERLQIIFDELREAGLA